MNLLISLRSEMLKTKRTAAFYVTVIAAAFGPLMSTLDLFLEGISAENEKIILSKMFMDKFQMTGLAILPMFLMLLCTLLPQIEYKNNAWKQILASPQTKGNVFASKFINIQFLVLLFLIVNQLAMLLGAVFLHFVRPSLNVLNQSLNVYGVLVMVVNIYVALLALSAIQFWLGLRYRNFIVPLAVGICLWFAGTVLVFETSSGAGAYFPYSFHVYGTMPKYESQLTAVHWASAAYAAAFLIFGFVDFARRVKR